MRKTFDRSEVDRIRDTTQLSDIVGRFVTFDGRKSNPGRGDYWACCPFHGEKRPSFHVEDGKRRYHCFGCGVSGDVFKFLMEQTGRTFPEVLAELGGRSEFVEDPAVAARRKRDAEARAAADERKATRKVASVREIAHVIWKESLPIAGTPAEIYLARRGVDFDYRFPSLRYHPELEYRDQGGAGVLGRFPCLVAAVQAPDDRFVAIWRIYVTSEGEKRADVPNAKLGLGKYAEYGAGVRLGDPAGPLNVAEGIESGFGVLGILRASGSTENVLATLNTTGMRSFIPPLSTTRLLIWPDGDVDRIRERTRDGESAEHKVASPGMTAARELRDRMKADDFPATIQPTPRNGLDYLDTFNRMKKAFPYG